MVTQETVTQQAPQTSTTETSSTQQASLSDESQPLTLSFAKPRLETGLKDGAKLLQTNLDVKDLLPESTTTSFHSSRYTEGAEKLRTKAKQLGAQVSELRSAIAAARNQLSKDSSLGPLIEKAEKLCEQLETRQKEYTDKAGFMDRASSDFSLMNSDKADKARQVVSMVPSAVNYGMKLHNAIVDGGDMVTVVKSAINDTSQHLVHSATTLAQVSATCGFVTAATELYDGYKNCKKIATGWTRKEEAKAILMTNKERDKLIEKIGKDSGWDKHHLQMAEKELKALDKTKHPKNAKKLQEKINGLKAKIETSNAKIETLKQMNKGVSKEAQAVAKQIHDRQGLGFKFLKVLKNALGVAGGVIMGLIAVGVAITPVGWAIAAGALVAGTSLLIYNQVKKRQRQGQIDQLGGNHEKNLKHLEDLKGQKTSMLRTQTQLQEQLHQLKGKKDPGSLKRIASLEARLTTADKELKALDNQINDAQDFIRDSRLAILAKSPDSAAGEILEGIKNKDPEMLFIAEHVMKISPPSRLLGMSRTDAIELMKKNGLSLAPAD